MKNIPGPLMRAIAQAQHLPDNLTEADFEIVEWDGTSPINGAAPAAVREVFVNAEGVHCPDARCVIARERASGIVFRVQPVRLDTNEPLRSDADVEQTAAQLRRDWVSQAPTLDVSATVMTLFKNAAAASGLSPQALAGFLGRLGG